MGERTGAMGGPVTATHALLPSPADGVVISNGFNKFPLATAAAEVDRRGRLSQLVTGAYPTSRAKKFARLSHSAKVARLLAREQAELDDRRVRALWLSETVYQGAAYGLLSRPLQPLASRVDRLSYKLYARQAAPLVASAPPSTRIYHYRSGFGHRSALLARQRGMVLLCDHSIAHPAVIQYLIDNDGQLPPPGVQLQLHPRRADLLEDIGHADALLVNSDFVKRTFVHQGWDPSKIHVIYMGIEDAFLDALPPRPAATSAELRLLFAGAIGRRKGAHQLLTALASLDDVPWRLELIGALERDVVQRHGRLLGDPRVECLGTLNLVDLARHMACADVFLFPSLAEGSARVVFMALASGCYVVTTPNSGSIVEDGINGALVDAGDADAISAAIRTVAADRDHAAEVGRANAQLIRARYRQADYGDALVALYDRLLVERAGVRP